MPADTSEVELLFNGMLQIGELALEILKDDFLSETADEVPRLTNTLANSIQATGGGGQWIIGTNIEYAGYVHEGHLTRPSHKQSGSTYMGQSIAGQGQHWVEGNPFFERAIDTVEGRTEDYVSQAITVLGLE